MAIEFTRKQYLKVWRGDRYISQHVSELECAESASEDAEIHGDGTYEIRVGSEVWYEVEIMGLLAGTDLVNVSPPDVNLPPEWTNTPNPSFVDGVGGTYALADDNFDPDDDALTHVLVSGAWPTGVSMDTAGLITATTGVVSGTTTGLQVSIDDTFNTPVNSPSFSLIVASQITDQELRDLGFLLVDDFPGVDPLGVGDSINGINDAMLEGTQDSKPVWFSAGGIYRVSDTVRCTAWDNSDQLVVRGGGGPLTSLARPVIRLDNAATGFGSAGSPRPVVAWRNHNKGSPSPTEGTYPSDPLDNSGQWAGQANVLFDSVFEGIDIDCGTNDGAFGIYFPAAQRCYAGEITITATNALGGWWGLLGRNSPIQNLKIIGGVWQIQNEARTAEGPAGSCIAGLTLVGDARTVTPIANDDFVPLTIVGFKITQTEDISIWTGASTNNTGYGNIVFIDGEITITGGTSTIFDNSNGKTCYMRNVYISGTDNIVQSGSESVITEVGTWKRINEYAYTDQRTNNPASRQYQTHSLIDGVLSETAEPATDTDDSVSSPPVNFVARHSMDMPSVDTGPFENIEDHGAVKSTGADPHIDFGKKLYWNTDGGVSPPYAHTTTPDSLAAFDAAIAAAFTAGHNTVVVPRGAYFVSGPVDLLKDTIFIGVSSNVSVVCVKDTWEPISNVYVIRTADDASGTCHMSHVSPYTRKIIQGGTNSHTVAYEHDFFSWVQWRTGRNSSSMQNVHDRQFVSPEIKSGPVNRYAWTDNAGGKHYAMGDAGGRTFGPDPARPCLISGTSEPLHIYGFNCEASKAGSPDISTNIEIINSSNVRMYNNKREGNGRTLHITNCDNIAVYGLGRQGHDDNVISDQHLIDGSSTNILIGISTKDQGDITITSDPMVKQDVTSPAGVVTSPNWPEGCSIYKLGTIDDPAATI